MRDFRRIASLKILPSCGVLILRMGLVASKLAHQVRLELQNINLYTEVEMSNQAKREYLQAIITRYRAASKVEKSKILDEFATVCDYERKHAITLLSGKYVPHNGKRTGRPRKYPPEILIPHIRFLWFRMGQLSAKRMKKAYDKWLPAYRENKITPQLKVLLQEMSISTLERILRKLRASGETLARGLGGTKPVKYFKNQIPIRTLDAEIDRPGHTQADTVAHCGTTLLGQFANTVTLTDIDSTWTEVRAVETKTATVILYALKDLEKTLPFPMLSLNTDSGSEFINHEVAKFCLNHNGRSIKFTRSRPYKKNDNCYVEQKNYTHVRELFGYERIEGPLLVHLMNEIYVDYWLPLHNFFIPTFKLKEKIRIGSKIKKIYGELQTPYDRLMQSKHLSEYRKELLKKRFEQLDPFVLSEGLQKKINGFNKAFKHCILGEIHAIHPTSLTSLG